MTTIIREPETSSIGGRLFDFFQLATEQPTKLFHHHLIYYLFAVLDCCEAGLFNLILSLSVLQIHFETWQAVDEEQRFLLG